MDWKEYLEISDENLDDLRLVGYSYIKQGCFDIAIVFFDALVILNPESSYDLQTLGSLYLQKGKYVNSLKYLDKAIDLDPNNFFAMLNRARALLSIGYVKQGLNQTRSLITCKDKIIAEQATALIEAYS